MCCRTPGGGASLVDRGVLLENATRRGVVCALDARLAVDKSSRVANCPFDGSLGVVAPDRWTECDSFNSDSSESRWRIDAAAEP